MFYVLQFHKPIGNPKKKRGQARFYCGYCDDDRFIQRMAEHRRGAGSALTRYAVQQKIGWQIVLTLHGKGRDFERWWKRQKNTPKLLSRYTDRSGLPW